MQAFLQNAFDQGARPRRTPAGALIVREGNKYRTLVDRDGGLTSAGTAWQNLTNTQLETSPFDTEQLPVRDGNIETILVRGERRATRSYDPVSNGWKYTRLGRRFYSRRQIQYVVRVPSIH